MGRRKTKKNEEEKKEQNNQDKLFTDFEGFPVEHETEYQDTLNSFFQNQVFSEKLQKLRRVMDLTSQQREFMQLWNGFMEKEKGDIHGITVDACLDFHLVLLVLRFLIEQRAIVKSKYRYQFLLHLTTLENYKKILKSDVYFLMEALEKTDVEIEALALELRVRSKRQKEVEEEDQAIMQTIAQGTHNDPIELD